MMTLSDLLKPKDGKPKDDKMSLRNLVRQKSFKSMVKAISKNNNPNDSGFKCLDMVGDGGRDESPSGTNTVGLL